MGKNRISGSWVQTPRAAHEAFDLLIKKNPSAARLMHRLVSIMDNRGGVVVSQKTLAEMLGMHRNTINKSIKALESDNWIEASQIGSTTGGVKLYTVNRRIAWADKRENMKYAAFDAKVIVSASEQGSGYLDEKSELRHVPREYETQIPSGEGIEPPSQTLFEGLEPNLPATE